MITQVQLKNNVYTLATGSLVQIPRGETLGVYYSFKYRVAVQVRVPVWGSLYRYTAGILDRAEAAQTKTTITLNPASNWRTYSGYIEIYISQLTDIGIYGLIVEIPEKNANSSIDDCIEVTGIESSILKDNDQGYGLINTDYDFRLLAPDRQIEITGISSSAPPGGVETGVGVFIQVHTRNLVTSPIRIYCIAFANEDQFIIQNQVVSSGSSYTFTGSFVMKDKDVIVKAYVLYEEGGILYASDAISIDVKLSTVIYYNLRIEINPPGGGTSDPSPGDSSHLSGETVRVRAIPSSGFTFEKAIVQIGGASEEYSRSEFEILMLSDIKIALYFETELLPGTTLLSPGSNIAPGPTIDTLTPTLKWQSVPGAAHYHVIVDEAPFAEGNIVVAVGDLLLPSYTIPHGVLKNGMQYRWIAAAIDEEGTPGLPPTNGIYFFITPSEIPKEPLPTFTEFCIVNYDKKPGG